MDMVLVELVLEVEAVALEAEVPLTQVLVEHKVELQHIQVLLVHLLLTLVVEQ